MTTPTEQRLHSYFDAVDAQVQVPPFRDLERGRSTPGRRSARWSQPARRWLAVAAAVTLVVLIGMGIVLLSGEAEHADIATVPPPTMAPAEFDAAAGAVCVELDAARAGVFPRFATAEAYRSVVASRRDAAEAATASLMALAPPADDPALPVSAVDELRHARDLLDQVDGAAERGDLDAASQLWVSVDPAIDRAQQALAAHGAVQCGP